MVLVAFYAFYDTKQFTEFKISSFVLVIRCIDPGSPINGKQVNTKNHYNYKDTLEFACNDNYTLEGYRQIKCKETKDWSGAVPYCRGNHNYVNFNHFVEAIIFLDLHSCVFTLGEMVCPFKTFKTGSQKIRYPSKRGKNKHRSGLQYYHIYAHKIHVSRISLF